MKILVVEDDEMILRALEFRLKKDSYAVVAARTGKEALEKLKSESFNLVITDLMLPFVTGMEVLSYIKSNLTSLPVIVLSGADEEGTVMDAFKLGADDFIAKPFSPGELTLRVKRLLVPFTARG
ncbi:response regulator receiver domain-containing protein [Pontibacter ummariensis]|uniref:Response regulator receiver domain-containing protein n=1 Tax=Pontibacter ummariensis TaxID=1610492 RepID=A0A239GI95_9BACT|nr:response regulator transcription factor [Pontibacter ummariensis]PRY11267.1 response regulator receiver domain-containing protein [Pontibacter ummariensis]SNS68488.1 Response regulator receiver domain-containing protein [Pontibacter ummariensis]